MFESYKTFFERYVVLNFLEWRLLQSKMGVLHYDKGDVILPLGSVCTHLLFMNTGLARGYLIDERGKDYTWSLHFNDDYAQMHNLFVTDYESFLHQTPSHIEIEALEACELFSIAYADLQLLYHTLKKGERFGRLMAELAYSQVHHYVIERQTKSASQRFDAFVHANPHLLDKIPQYHIATYLGITPQHLSRLKKGYQLNKGE